MALAIRIPDFLLKKDIEHTRCNPSGKCTGTETFWLIKGNYIIDLVIQRNLDSKPTSATAYMPNVAACSRGLPRSSHCQLDLLFEGEQLEKLISRSPQSSKVSLAPAMAEKNSLPPLTPVLGNNLHILEAPQSIRAADLLLPAHIAKLIGGAASTAIHVVRQLRNRDAFLRSVLRNESHHEDKITAIQASSAAAHAQVSKPAKRPFAVNNKRTSQESQDDISLQIEEILLRVDSPEQRMTARLVKTSFEENKIGESS